MPSPLGPPRTLGIGLRWILPESSVRRELLRRPLLVRTSGLLIKNSLSDSLAGARDLTVVRGLRPLQVTSPITTVRLRAAPTRPGAFPPPTAGNVGLSGYEPPWDCQVTSPSKTVIESVLHWIPPPALQVRLFS